MATPGRPAVTRHTAHRATVLKPCPAIPAAIRLPPTHRPATVPPTSADIPARPAFMAAAALTATPLTIITHPLAADTFPARLRLMETRPTPRSTEAGGEHLPPACNEPTAEAGKFNQPWFVLWTKVSTMRTLCRL